jgi:hypothetical protein
MADAIVSPLGAVLGAEATLEERRALMLKVFSGEVLTIFENTVATKGRIQFRSIASGKSAQFPVMGRASAYYHTPGNEILGGKIKKNERVITIDELLIAPTFIADIDDAMNHYDVRSHYSQEIGRVLANQWDRHVLQVGVLAARTTVANIPDESPAGTTITEATAGEFDDPDALVEVLVETSSRMDEKNIPEQGRFAFLDPRDYNRLIMSEKAIVNEYRGQGSIATGTIPQLMGMEIVKTNQLPRTNVTADTVEAGTEDKYLGDFRKTRALVMHQSAVGTVQLIGLKSRADYDPRRLGWLLNAMYSVGHGVLRPESAVEIANA